MQTMLRILERAGGYRPTLSPEIKNPDEHRLLNAVTDKPIRS